MCVVIHEKKHLSGVTLLDSFLFHSNTSVYIAKMRY